MWYKNQSHFSKWKMATLASQTFIPLIFPCCRRNEIMTVLVGHVNSNLARSSVHFQLTCSVCVSGLHYLRATGASPWGGYIVTDYWVHWDRSFGLFLSGCGLKVPVPTFILSSVWKTRAVESSDCNTVLLQQVWFCPPAEYDLIWKDLCLTWLGGRKCYWDALDRDQNCC